MQGNYHNSYLPENVRRLNYVKRADWGMLNLGFKYSSDFWGKKKNKNKIKNKTTTKKPKKTNL